MTVLHRAAALVHARRAAGAAGRLQVDEGAGGRRPLVAGDEAVRGLPVGFGHIGVSDIEVSNMLANMV